MKINRKIIEKKFNDNLDDMATISHEIWAHWQTYLHSQCEKMPDGSLKIPKELVEQWNKQIKLEYRQLTQNEKNSDIEQAIKYKEIFLKIINEITEQKDA